MQMVLYELSGMSGTLCFTVQVNWADVKFEASFVQMVWNDKYLPGRDVEDVTVAVVTRTNTVLFFVRKTPSEG